MNSGNSSATHRPAMALLLLTGLTVALGRLVCPAQTNYVIDQFNSNTTASYVNQDWGTAVPTIIWSTNNALTGLAPNTPGSGSAKWVIPWTTTGDQVMVTHSFGATLNLNQFTSISYDILFDPSTATDGFGNIGAIQVAWIPAADGWPSTANPPMSTMTFASGNSNWIHVTMALSAAGNSKLAAVTGIGLKIQQKTTGANLSGTTMFCLDNIMLGVPGPISIYPLNPPQLWNRLEFEVDNVPAFGNPFDPASISLNTVFTLPSGKTMSVPAFWYQGYWRSGSSRSEVDTLNGTPGWRLRFTPPEAGDYTLAMTIGTNNQIMTNLTINFSVPNSPLPARYGYVGVSTNHQYFQTGDGRALPLNGLNLCWPSGMATYDYDNWFGSLHGAGGNFARIWMWPGGDFSIEDTPGTLTNYALAPAWKLDYVLQQAELKGIYLQLTLVYYGMFATLPDYWGGNNFWPSNPYCITNGGPCPNPDAFFTSSTARTLFEKRLRYLVARYGYSQNLLAWEFCNEIDNEYSVLSPTDVQNWHGTMGNWLHNNDPFGHLRTTSLSSASSYPGMWELSQIDFSSEHIYTESSSPLSLIASDAQSFLNAYNKPVMVGEFGTSWMTWDNASTDSYSVDPYLRGFREGIWAGALGGSTGTSMAWWWQNIASGNDYYVYSALNTILGGTAWGAGSWTNLTFASGQTQFSALGQHGPNESLLYLVAADAIFPSGATNASLPMQESLAVTMSNWPQGQYNARWYDPASGGLVGTSQAATSGGGKLTLSLPNFTVDLAGIVFPPPTLSSPQFNAGGRFQLQLNSETGGHYYLLRSTNLASWVTLLTVTNATGAMWLTDSVPASASACYQAEHAP